MTPERFARGMTFEEYVTFAGSPENLAREGFDIRRFSLVRPRVDWGGYLRERHARARLGDDQRAAIAWLAAQPGGPAHVLVLSEDWSSDCRRDVPYLARLAEAGGLTLRIFARDGDTMLRAGIAGGDGRRQRRPGAGVRQRQERSAVRLGPGGRLLHARLRRAVSLRRVSGHLSQGPGDRSPARRRAGESDERPRPAAAATSPRSSTPPSSTSGPTPPSPKSSAPSTNACTAHAPNDAPPTCRSSAARSARTRATVAGPRHIERADRSWDATAPPGPRERSAGGLGGPFVAPHLLVPAELAAHRLQTSSRRTRPRPAR